MSDKRPFEPRVVLVVPCYNEADGIAAVLAEYRSVWPAMELHVFDNSSTDNTALVARASGATVHRVALRGKGNVVRRIFADVDADIYVLTDGDLTYAADHLAEHIQRMQDEGLDMIVGRREDDDGKIEQYRTGHRMGNWLLTSAAQWSFGGAFADMLSGYRLFSRRFAKSFAAHSRGFEIETELTVHALELRMPCAEVPVSYRARAEGSSSKLSTWRDGWRILRTIVRLLVTERPLLTFMLLAGFCVIASLALGLPVVTEFLLTGLVMRLPTALLATGLMLLGGMLAVCGILLDQVTLARQEIKHFYYLGIPQMPSRDTDEISR